MTRDFSKPQKQAAIGIVILFADVFQKVIRALIVPFVFIIAKSQGHTALYILMALTTLAVVLAVFSYFSYHNFSFFLDQEKQEFIINEGVFNKTNLTIQLNKIQNVHIKQSFIQQIIGVYSLEIDTAGSEKREAKIRAIDHENATLLKQRLLGRDNFETEPQSLSSVSEALPFLKLDFTTLFKVGVTSNYGASIVLLGGFAFAVIQMLNDYRKAYKADAAQIHQVLEKGIGLFSIGFMVVLALVVILITNIVRTFLKYYNFEIVRQKNTLAISSGLFTKNNTLLKPNKVQISTYSQNYFQQKFDLINMKIKQASYQDDHDKKDKKSGLEIPGCNTQERNEVLKMIYGRMPVEGLEYAPDYRFLFLQVMIYVVFPSLLFSFLALFIIHLPGLYLYYLIPYIISVFIALWFEYQHHRLYVDQDFIIKKRGIWDVEYEIIEPYKIQSITLKQYFWHKKANIGHLMLHTAGGKIYFGYGNYQTLQELVNYWSYKVESSEKNWM